MSTLDENEMNLVGRANQLLHWLKSNKHCGYCGLKKKFDEKEEAMFCSCNNVMTYPTISPCILALIKKDNQILLARNSLFPKGLYSALAGFIEVSETAEETVEREIALRDDLPQFFSHQVDPGKSLGAPGARSSSTAAASEASRTQETTG